MMHKPFLENAVSETNWWLYDEKKLNNVGSYHYYTDSRFASVRNSKHQNETADRTKRRHSILFLRQMRIVKKSLQVISTGNTKQYAILHCKTKRPHNHCFNCWRPRCSLQTFRKKNKPVLSRHNLYQWKRMPGFSQKSIYSADFIEPNIIEKEAKNVLPLLPLTSIEYKKRSRVKV